MIRYVLISGNTSSFLEVTATFPDRNPIIIKTSGKPKHMRQVLRNEFEGHLQLLVADMRRLLRKRIPFVPAANVANDLHQLEQQHVHSDHVTYARALADMLPDLRILEAATDQPLMMNRLYNDLTRTVEYMTEHPESLWVRGPIQQLDGSIHEPWKTQNAA